MLLTFSAKPGKPNIEKQEIRGMSKYTKQNEEAAGTRLKI